MSHLTNPLSATSSIIGLGPIMFTNLPIINQAEISQHFTTYNRFFVGTETSFAYHFHQPKITTFASTIFYP